MVIWTLTNYQYQKCTKKVGQSMQKNVVIEQISIKIGMIILKAAIQIHTGGHIESSFLYVFGFLS